MKQPISVSLSICLLPLFSIFLLHLVSVFNIIWLHYKFLTQKLITRRFFLKDLFVISLSLHVCVYILAHVYLQRLEKVT